LILGRADHFEILWISGFGILGFLDFWMPAKIGFGDFRISVFFQKLDLWISGRLHKFGFLDDVRKLDFENLDFAGHHPVCVDSIQFLTATVQILSRLHPSCGRLHPDFER
jgi:hypothetical protein